MTCIQVNWMCLSSMDQVRSIANIITAVAKGDLTQKIEIKVEGEVSTWKRTVNAMRLIECIRQWGDEGSLLGGQARVENVQGTWGMGRIWQGTTYVSPLVLKSVFILRWGEDLHSLFVETLTDYHRNW